MDTEVSNGKQDYLGETTGSEQKNGNMATNGDDSSNLTIGESFKEVYTKFKMHFYREIFGRFDNREATLTTVETFCMEVICAMDRPTINEFANFIKISQPNAAYKVNNLIKKGYLTKVQSTKDRREFFLEVTQKYLDYFNISSGYMQDVIGRLDDRLSDEDKASFKKTLEIISNELMHDIPNYRARKRGE